MSQEPQPSQNNPPPPMPPYPGFSVPPPYPGFPPPAYMTPAYNQTPRQQSSAPIIFGVLGGCLILVLVVFIGGSIIAGLAFSNIIHTLKNTKTVYANSSQTIAVTDVPTIDMNLPMGSYTVLTGPSNQVVVSITKYASAADQAKAQSLLNQVTYTIQQQGNTIGLTTSNPSTPDLFAQWRMAITLTVPAKSNLILTDDVGQITVQDITGQLALKTSTGTIQLSHVTLLGNSALQSNVGEISLSEQSVLQDNTHVNIQTNVGRVSSDLSFGANDTLIITSNIGDIDLTMPHTTIAHMTAQSGSSGNITITGFTLPITSHGINGDTAPNPTNNVTLKTSVGNITIDGL